jgi:hypothetical protein
MAGKAKTRRVKEKDVELLKLREAALELRVSFPTIKQWIYKGKIHSVQTAGGAPVPHPGEDGSGTIPSFASRQRKKSTSRTH